MSADIAEPTEEIVLGGKLYTASRLTDKDIVELDRWVRAEWVRTARDSAEGKSPEYIAAVEERAMKFAAGISAFDGVGFRFFGTVEGISRLAWKSLQKCHPELTFEYLRDQIFNPDKDDVADSINRFNKAFRVVNHTPAVPKGAVKKGARRVHRRR